MKKTWMFALVALFAGLSQTAAGQVTGQPNEEQARRDQLRIAVQEICPVSGQKLGEHGAPVKAQVGEETIFLCCQGCLKGQIKPENWAKIHANFARAQQICPVMENKLPESPKWTIAEGQIIYVCCPPCTEKIAADPEKYLRKVDELYMASLRSRGEIR
jgi:YHS domain-containing protein